MTDPSPTPEPNSPAPEPSPPEPPSPSPESGEREKEIDLNPLFPEAEGDLNALFPDPEIKRLLKSIQKNKKDLHNLRERFTQENPLDDEGEEEEGPADED